MQRSVIYPPRAYTLTMLTVIVDFLLADTCSSYREPSGKNLRCIRVNMMAEARWRWNLYEVDVNCKWLARTRAHACSRVARRRLHESVPSFPIKGHTTFELTTSKLCWWLQSLSMWITGASYTTRWEWMTNLTITTSCRGTAILRSTMTRADLSVGWQLHSEMATRTLAWLSCVHIFRGVE